jgi:hypothetical protein
MAGTARRNRQDGATRLSARQPFQLIIGLADPGGASLLRRRGLAAIPEAREAGATGTGSHDRTPQMFVRPFPALALAFGALMGCATADPTEPMAVDERFARYQGAKLYNFGISVDAFALAPPGIPLVASPKSALVVTVTIWDDAAQAKLNEEGKQFTVFEGASAESAVLGSGLTRSREEQMERLSRNAAKEIERWMLQNPEWFGIADAPVVAPLPAAATLPTGTAAAATGASAVTTTPLPPAPVN